MARLMMVAWGGEGEWVGTRLLTPGCCRLRVDCLGNRVILSSEVETTFMMGCVLKNKECIRRDFLRCKSPALALIRTSAKFIT